MRSALRVLLAAASVTALAACGSDSRSAIEVEGLRMQRVGDGTIVLSGVVHNRSGARVGSADVFVQLYDDDNLPIEDVQVTVAGLAPGDSSRFERKLDVDARRAGVRFVATN
ncbi:MAG: FxLYD domain-containing protein [Rubricoccaceae bacterium]